jgi:hypothetical protein
VRATARAWSRGGGFTIVEVIASLFVFVLGAITLMSAMSGAWKLDVLERERTWARMECRRQLDNLLQLSKSQLLALDGTQFDVASDFNGDGVISAGERLRPRIGAARVGTIYVKQGAFTDPFDSTFTITGDPGCYCVVIEAVWLSDSVRSASQGRNINGVTSMRQRLVYDLGEH